MKSDFDKWMTKIGINASGKQPPQQRALLLILENFFNYIVDLQNRIEFLERNWK